MVRIDADDPDPEDLERITHNPDVVRDAWERTLQETRGMMNDRENDGYETFFLPAGDVTPKNPETGDTDEWGLSYLVPGNKVEPFQEFDDRAEFDDTIVYQNNDQGNMFIVTELLDTERKLTLFIAGAYRMRHAPPMVRTAMERGEMRTHIKKLDGTKLRTFVHDDPSAFFPEPDAFYAYETDEMYGLE